jgi:uncharacterized protein DUF4115
MPPGAMHALVVAVSLVGIIATTALVLSIWQLARSNGTETARPQETVTVRATQPTDVAETPPARRPAAAPARVVLTASRGDCWLEARVGSAAGTLLFAGNLEQGRSLRLAKRRLWLAFGAGANLEVTLNGRRVESFPTGTAAVLVTAKGISGPMGI